MKLEICVDNIESVATATKYGADRLELCSALSAGGLTPTPGLVSATKRISDLPRHCMIRPRAGDFIYSEQELLIMIDDIHHLSQLGVHGFVFGTLTAQGKVNTEQLARLCQAAAGHQVTFHRAFDYTDDPSQSLEEIIAMGCNTVLTSGLQASAADGLETLVNLQRQAGERLVVMPGAGVTPQNIALFSYANVFQWIHMSAKKQRQTSAIHRPSFSMGANLDDDLTMITTDSEQLTEVKTILNSVCSSPAP